MNTKGSATIAFMVGAVAGGVAALLWAPQTGARLRQRIKEGADDLHTKGERFKEATREKKEAITGTVKGVVAEARQTYKDELEKRRLVDSESIARKTGA